MYPKYIARYSRYRHMNTNCHGDRLLMHLLLLLRDSFRPTRSDRSLMKG